MEIINSYPSVVHRVTVEVRFASGKLNFFVQPFRGNGAVLTKRLPLYRPPVTNSVYAKVIHAYADNGDFFVSSLIPCRRPSRRVAESLVPCLVAENETLPKWFFLTEFHTQCRILHIRDILERTHAPSHPESQLRGFGEHRVHPLQETRGGVRSGRASTTERGRSRG